jgi:hypothetical protein
MNDTHEERVAITINVAPPFEERVVDWLLARDAASGFTSYEAFGHGARQDELSLSEQVQGRQRRIEFRVELPSGALDALVVSLTASFAGTDLYYYVTSVLRSGHLRRIVK